MPPPMPATRGGMPRRQTMADAVGQQMPQEAIITVVDLTLSDDEDDEGDQEGNDAEVKQEEEEEDDEEEEDEEDEDDHDHDYEEDEDDDDIIYVGQSPARLAVQVDIKAEPDDLESQSGRSGLPQNPLDPPSRGVPAAQARSDATPSPPLFSPPPQTPNDTDNPARFIDGFRIPSPTPPRESQARRKMASLEPDDREAESVERFGPRLDDEEFAHVLKNDPVVRLGPALDDDEFERVLKDLSEVPGARLASQESGDDASDSEVDSNESRKRKNRSVHFARQPPGSTRSPSETPSEGSRSPTRRWRDNLPRHSDDDSRNGSQDDNRTRHQDSAYLFVRHGGIPESQIKKPRWYAGFIPRMPVPGSGGSGKGSVVLSRDIRARILHAMVGNCGEKADPVHHISKLYPRLNSAEKIAAAVDAEDQVEEAMHAAADLQLYLSDYFLDNRPVDRARVSRRIQAELVELLLGRMAGQHLQPLELLSRQHVEVNSWAAATWWIGADPQDMNRIQSAFNGFRETLYLKIRGGEVLG